MDEKDRIVCRYYMVQDGGVFDWNLISTCETGINKKSCIVDELSDNEGCQENLTDDRRSDKSRFVAGSGHQKELFQK